MDYIEVTHEPLSLDSISDLIRTANDYFSAIIDKKRDDYKGKVITSDYNTYENITKEFFKEVCLKVRVQYSDVKNIAIYFRLNCGNETNLVVAVTSASKSDLFDIVGWIVDHIKNNLPIHDIPSNLIQVNVSSSEMKRRIDKFIEKSCKQVQERNNINFFANDDPEKCDSFCCRVDAKYEKRVYSNGYLEVNSRDLAASNHPTVSEVTKHEVYERLKSAENRLLRLEEIDPRYANYWTENMYIDKGSYKHQKWSVDCVDQVISQLKERNARLSGLSNN